MHIGNAAIYMQASKKIGHFYTINTAIILKFLLHFAIEDQHRLFIKDFNVIEDELKISGLNENFNYDTKSKNTYIFDDDGDVVAKIKGVLDLSEVNII